MCGVLGFSSAASAAECAGNADALGTSRVVAVDPAKLPLIGFMQYRTMVELQPKEVILTFDDGPLPPSTNRVLETLRQECVKATFFIVGQMAKAYPNVLRQVAAEGHSIGTHSVTHPLIFTKLSAERGRKEIDNGFAIVNDILAHLSPRPRAGRGHDQIGNKIRQQGDDRAAAVRHPARPVPHRRFLRLAWPWEGLGYPPLDTVPH